MKILAVTIGLALCLIVVALIAAAWLMRGNGAGRSLMAAFLAVPNLMIAIYWLRVAFA